MGVSYFRRQQSCAKVVYKLRSSAGTEHKAPAGAFKTTLRIVTSLDFLLGECSNQNSRIILDACVSKGVALPGCPTSNRVYGPGHHRNWAAGKESSYRENLKLFLPLTNRYASRVAGIPSILSNIHLIWLFSSKSRWYCALWSFADMHGLMNRWGHFVPLITWVVEINHRVIIAIFSTYIMYPGIKMVGMKAQDVVPSSAVKFFGAGTAACIADLVTFPLDTAKVRLQVWGTESFQHLNFRLLFRLLTNCSVIQRKQIQGESQKVGGSSGTKYRGVFGTITTMVRTEGPRSLYSGLVAGLQRQMSFASVRIGLYDSMKQFYTRGTESEWDSVVWAALSRRFVSCAHVTQVQGSSLVSWRAAPREPWPWLLHNQQMWWRCDSKPKYEWLTVGGDTTAPWTPTRRLLETKAYGAFGKVPH